MATLNNNYNYNNDEDFGPQRYCICHNGITIEDIIDDEMEREFHETSRTKLVFNGDGAFTCPACGKIFETEVNEDAEAILNYFPEEKINYSSHEDNDMTKSKSIALDNCSKYELLSACTGDIVMAENLANIMNQYLLTNEKDGIGREYISFMEDYGNGHDIDDINYDFDEDNSSLSDGYDDVDADNISASADKILPWIGETINILGMENFRTTDENGNEIIIPGIFQRYYKIDHAKLADKVSEKAKIAKDVIYTMANTMVDGEYIIQDYIAKYLLSNLVDEYEYWMEWTKDPEWNNLTKFHYFRSNAIEHLNKGGELLAYEYAVKDGSTKTGYHPDTYVREGVKYIPFNMDMLLVNNSNDITEALVEYISETNCWWSEYMYNGKTYINVMVYDRSNKPRIGLSVIKTDAVFLFISSTNARKFNENTFGMMNTNKHNGVKIQYNMYYFIKELGSLLGVKSTTINKIVSSNRWLVNNI